MKKLQFSQLQLRPTDFQPPALPPQAMAISTQTNQTPSELTEHCSSALVHQSGLSQLSPTQLSGVEGIIFLYHATRTTVKKYEGL